MNRQQDTINFIFILSTKIRQAEGFKGVQLFCKLLSVTVMDNFLPFFYINITSDEISFEKVHILYL